jgi:hypothetical protein
MKAINSIGMFVLAIWLVAQGLVSLFRVNNPTVLLALPILAILSGVLLLLRIRDSKPAVNLGFLLLSVWLILTGMIPLLNVGSLEISLVLAVLGLAAGILILVGQ